MAMVPRTMVGFHELHRIGFPVFGECGQPVYWRPQCCSADLPVGPELEKLT